MSKTIQQCPECGFKHYSDAEGGSLRKCPNCKLPFGPKPRRVAQ